MRRALKSQPPSAEQAGGTPRSSKPIGTALTLSDRPFLSELWPDLDCVPMMAGLADEGDGPAASASRGARTRTLEVFLDRVCLEASGWAEHLLDPNFSGTLTPDDLQLKRELLELLEGLQTDPSSARAAAAAPVKEMLRRLGSPDPDWDDWTCVNE